MNIETFLDFFLIVQPLSDLLLNWFLIYIGLYPPFPKYDTVFSTIPSGLSIKVGSTNSFYKTLSYSLTQV